MRRCKRPFACWGIAAIVLVGCLALGALAQVEIGPGEGPGSGGEEAPPVRVDDCSVVCYENIRCLGTDVPCPGCDELGGNTCADVTYVNYNPGNAAILKAYRSPENCTADRAVRLPPVICVTTQECGEGALASWSICTTGTMCVGTFPIPSFCQTCVLVGTPYNRIVGTWDCVFHPDCCPPCSADPDCADRTPEP